MLRNISLSPLDTPRPGTYRGQIAFYPPKVYPTNLRAGHRPTHVVSCPNNITAARLKQSYVQHRHVETANLPLTYATYPKPNATRKLYELGLTSPPKILSTFCRLAVETENVGKNVLDQSYKDPRCEKKKATLRR